MMRWSKLLPPLSSWETKKNQVGLFLPRFTVQLWGIWTGFVDLAASLLQRGINPGDRVAFLLPNCLEIVLCYYACFKIGAIAVPLNIRFQPELLKYCLTHSEARVLISEPELFDRIEEIRSLLPGVERYYLTTGHSTYTGVRPFDELLEATFDSARLPVLDENCAAAIYYTSGTTGLPKGVIHSHASLTRATQIQIDQIAISSEDRTLIMFPICYLIGFGSQILPFHSRGASCILQPDFEPRLALEAIQTYKPTKTYGFPQLYNDLVNCPQADQYDIRSLISASPPVKRFRSPSSSGSSEYSVSRLLKVAE